MEEENNEDHPTEETIEEQDTEQPAPDAAETIETDRFIPPHILEKPDLIESAGPTDEVPHPTGVIIEIRGRDDEQKKNLKQEDEFAADFFEEGGGSLTSIQEISGMTAVAVEELEEGDAKPTKYTTDDEILLEDTNDQDVFDEQDESSVVARTSKLEKKISQANIKESISKYVERQSIDTRKVMQRKSMKSRSIAYESLPRMTSEQDLNELFGLDIDVDNHVQIYDYGDQEEEEEEMATPEDVAPPLDRGPYYEKHEIITKEIAERKVKNFILQKKLSIFFKKRRMEHALKDTGEQQFETMQNYGRKLDTYGELLQIDKRERQTINSEIESYRTQREEQFEELQKLFTTMQNREKDVGTGLINTKTCNAISDKLVERFIRRQKNTMDEVCSMRLTFIKLKDIVQEKLDEIAALDRIGEDLHLIDYEQLKVENRTHADKIEEREEELIRLRAKCQNTIQVLAHIREKSSSLETDVEDLQDELNTVQSHAIQIRETLNYLKQRRDHFRHMTNKLREDSGLLTQPALLEDMEKSLTDVTYLSEELNNLLEGHKSKAKQMRNIRKHIEIQSEGYIKKVPLDKMKSKTKIGTDEAQIYKGRPCLYMPTLSKNAFDHLKDIKSRPVNWPKRRDVRL